MVAVGLDRSSSRLRHLTIVLVNIFAGVSMFPFLSAPSCGLDRIRALGDMGCTVVTQDGRALRTVLADAAARAASLEALLARASAVFQADDVGTAPAAARGGAKLCAPGGHEVGRGSRLRLTGGSDQDDGL